MTLEEALKAIEAKLNDVQLALRVAPDCRNRKPGDDRACPSKEWGMHKGRNRFWYGSDCTLPVKKFCDPCLAYWHIAVARNIVILEQRKEAYRAAHEGHEMHRTPEPGSDALSPTTPESK